MSFISLTVLCSYTAKEGVWAVWL